MRVPLPSALEFDLPQTSSFLSEDSDSSNIWQDEKLSLGSELLPVTSLTLATPLTPKSPFTPQHSVALTGAQSPVKTRDHEALAFPSLSFLLGALNLL